MATVPDIQPVVHKSPLSSDRQRTWLALIVIAAATFVLYCGTLSFEFVWDDGDQIINNPLLRSWHSIPRIFGSDLWFHTAHSQFYYRPFFVIWEILNFKLFAVKPWGWHLTTVLLHVLATCAVYWLARALKIDHWTSAIAALIFGLHPIHVECASWVSAGSDSMVTILYVLAFIAYLKAHHHQDDARRLWRILSFVLLACALLTKEMAITFALMVAVYEWLSRNHVPTTAGSRIRNAIQAAIPYLLITAGYFFLRRMALGATTQLDPAHTNADVLRTLPLVLFVYLKLLLVPKGLTVGYYIPYVTSLGFKNFVLPVVALLVTTAVIGYWGWHRKDPRIGFCAAWLVLGLIPVLYIRLFAPGSGVHDRYIYLPSVAFALLVALAIRSLRLQDRARNQALQIALSAAISITLFIGSLLQQVYWGNDLLLFYRACALYPHNNESLAVDLANALIRKRAYGRAIPILKHVVEQNPDSGIPHAVLAQAYLRVGQPQDARRELDEALRSAPELLRSLKGMTDVANVYGELGDYQKAVPLYEQVLHQEPDFYDALYNGGLTYFLAGDNERAQVLFLRATQVAPGLESAPFYLGRTYLRTSRPELAERFFREALTINPAGYSLHYWLGQALAAQGESNAARNAYREELKLYPTNQDAVAQLNIGTTPDRPQVRKR